LYSVCVWCKVGYAQSSASGTEADGAQASEAGVEAVKVAYREDGKSEASMRSGTRIRNGLQTVDGH
jgi:6-phosphofructokinase